MHDAYLDYGEGTTARQEDSIFTFCHLDDSPRDNISEITCLYDSENMPNLEYQVIFSDSSSSTITSRDHFHYDHSYQVVKGSTLLDMTNSILYDSQVGDIPQIALPILPVHHTNDDTFSDYKNTNKGSIHGTFLADGERTATSTVDIGNDPTNIENILEDATPPNSPPTRVMLPDTSTTHKHINNNMSQCLTLPPIIKQRVPFIPINVGTLPIVQRNVDQNLLRNLSPKSTNSQGENRGHSSEPYYVDYARANHFPITDALILPIPSTPSNSITTKQVKREKLRMHSADNDSNTITLMHRCQLSTGIIIPAPAMIFIFLVILQILQLTLHHWK